MGAPVGIFGQIQSMLETGGAYNDVYELLDTIRDNLTTEQATQLSVFNAQMDDCDSETELREGEIAEAESANDAAKRQLLACTTAEEGAGLAEGVYGETVSNKRSALQKETTLRAAQKTIFEHQEDQLEELLRSIEQALDYVATLEGTQSAELVNQLIEVATVLTMGAISTDNFDKVTPFLVSFAQMQGVGDTNPYGVVGAEASDVAFLKKTL